MKIGIAQEILGLSRPTLLKKLEGFNNKKTNSGENILSWSDVTKLFYKNKKLDNRKNKPTVITLCQNKGGVGKTTTSINLGYLFSCIGKTLIIDNDSQANLSQSFNVFESLGLKDFLESPKTFEEKKINDNLFIIPNDLSFDTYKSEKIELKSNDTKYLLAKSLKEIKNNYEYIIIDCPPALDLSFKMSLLSSDYALIVLDGHPFSLNGLQNIISEIEKTKEDETTLNLSILGVFFARFNNKATLPNQVNSIAKNQDIKVFNNFIRETIQIPESQAKGVSIFEYAEKSNACFDYFGLFKEILEEIN